MDANHGVREATKTGRECELDRNGKDASKRFSASAKASARARRLPALSYSGLGPREAELRWTWTWD